MCLSDDLPHRCGSGFGVMSSYGVSNAAMESYGFLFGLKGHETGAPL
ncbi:hypothetical protein CUAC110533_05640 [Cutibacterium acnes subsp. elongatum]|jgi:hypothetical protein